MILFKRILLIFIVLFFISSLTKNIFDYRNKIQFYESYKKEYEDIKKKNLSLKTQILKQSDPYEVEKTIRNELNLLKENEVDVIVPLPTPTVAIPTPTLPPNWQQWYSLFFDTK